MSNCNNLSLLWQFNAAKLAVFWELFPIVSQVVSNSMQIVV